MIGIKILQAGLLLLLLGFTGIALYQTNTVSDPLVMSIGSIGVLLGGFLVVFGMISSALIEFTPKSGIHRGDTAIFSHTLIRCMIAITVADNVLDDDEVEAVSKIYKQVTGSNISEKVIRDTADEMLKNGVDIISELINTRDSLDKTSKEKIIIASLYILAADGVMDESEEHQLEAIRDGLKVPNGRFKKIKKDFLKSRNLRKK